MLVGAGVDTWHDVVSGGMTWHDVAARFYVRHVVMNCGSGILSVAYIILAVPKNSLVIKKKLIGNQQTTAEKNKKSRG